MFDDGHSYCFSCALYIPSDGSQPIEKKVREDVDWLSVNGSVRALDHRGIDKDVCKRFNYRVASNRGEAIEVANYIADGIVVAQHLRKPNKEFPWLGDTSKVRLWGEQLWKRGGRRIIVTEGEIDCMTVWQIIGKKWPVVSVPTGAAGAAKAFRASLEFLNSYTEIVICFDNDEAGAKAALECAQLLRPGKAKIVSLPYKDANAMLLKGETQSLVNCLWEAQTYRPDGIIHIKDVQDVDDDQIIWPYPWRDVTKALVGQRSGEIVMWTSGTGMGKSTVLRHLINDHLDHNRTVGVLMLEESIQETRDDIISIMIKKPVRQIRAARKVNAALSNYGQEAIDFGIIDDLTDDEYDKGRAELASRPLILYNHDGANDFDGITAKMEYMAIALGCDVVILDHVTAVVAATDYNGKGERRGIDELMGDLRSLVSRTGVHLDIVSQLKRPDGKPFEEGGRISAAHLRGSGSLASVPNVIIAIERNQQDPNPESKNTILMRVLKNRFYGFTGIAAALRWDASTMSLTEVEFHEESDGSVSYGPKFNIDEETKDDGAFDFLSPDTVSGGGTVSDGEEGTGELLRQADSEQGRVPSAASSQ